MVHIDVCEHEGCNVVAEWCRDDDGEHYLCREHMTEKGICWSCRHPKPLNEFGLCAMCTMIGNKADQ